MKWTLAPMPGSLERRRSPRPRSSASRSSSRRTMYRCQAWEPSAASSGSSRRSALRTARNPVAYTRRAMRPAGREQLVRPLELDESRAPRRCRSCCTCSPRPRSRSTRSRSPRSGSRRPADPVERHHPGPVGDRVVVGDEHAALAGRDRLRGIERERAGPSERAGVPAARSADPARKRVRRVLDDRDAPRLEQRDQSLDLDRHAGDVDRDHRLGPRRDGREDRSPASR